MLVLGALGQPALQRDNAGSFASYIDSGWYHNAAAAVVRDGEIEAASEEERFTRRKGSGKFPVHALRFCLEHMDASLSDIDIIAFGERGGEGFLLDPEISAERIAQVLGHELDSGADLRGKITCVEHHRAHAYSALVPSAYSSALVFTADGFGDGISGTAWAAEGGKLVARLCDIPFDKSLGRFYSSVLPYFSYVDDDEYKVMGLAPHGDPGRYRNFFDNLYSLNRDGDYSILFHDKTRMYEELSSLGPPRLPGEIFTSHHADIAAALQEAFERLVLHILRFLRKTSGLSSLCLAGGTAQNSVCNGRIRAEKIFDHVFVQPASHDAGIAVGACYAALVDAGRPDVGRRQSPYLGRHIGTEMAVTAAISGYAPMINAIRPADLIEQVSGRLARGEVCGWAQGRSEFGPRALGNRSILADPRTVTIKDRINEAIKNRESFRPFAPVVHADDVHKFFDVLPGEEFPFMTIVVPVREEYRDALAAITHIDGTARLQTITDRDNLRLCELLRAFEVHAGFPVLLNTSFNSNGEPIVDTASDALMCFLRSGLDFLVLGDFLITRSAAWRDELSRRSFRLTNEWALEPSGPGQWTLFSSAGASRTLPSCLHDRAEVIMSRQDFTVGDSGWDDIYALWLSRTFEI
jgi:carbamoyltransferase